jgi:predicted nucleic acid-binding protein
VKPGFVLDCSVAASWAFEDEAEGYPDVMLGRLGEEEAVVPQHWALEVSNALATGERRGRITESDILRFVHLLGLLPITTDGATAERALGETLSLAREQRLSSYDAAYLELALRLGLPLATQDRALAAAAAALGVEALA